MIFSSQLGKVNTASPQDGIAQVANHIRKMQEELEYRLMNLSSDNISEIDAKQTTILLSDGTSLEDGIGGGYTEIQLSVEGIRSTVAAQGQKISQVEQRADGIATQVQDISGRFDNYSTIEQTAESITTAVSSLSETINGQLGSYSTITQTSEAITAAVTDLKKGLGMKVTLDDNGLWVEDAAGAKTQITGSHIKVSSLTEDDVHTLITGDLVSSPKVMGGEFFDEEGVGRLMLAYDGFDFPLLAYDWGYTNSRGKYTKKKEIFWVRADEDCNNIIFALGGIELFKIMDGEVYVSNDFMAAL